MRIGTSCPELPLYIRRLDECSRRIAWTRGVLYLHVCSELGWRVSALLWLAFESRVGVETRLLNLTFFCSAFLDAASSVSFKCCDCQVVLDTSSSTIVQ